MTSRQLTVAVTLTGVLGTAAAARAQGAAGAEPPPRFSTEIVVTPDRGATPRNAVPVSTAVLAAQDLAARPIVHPAEALSFLPGFVVSRAQLDAGRPVVAARGFFGGGEAEYVLLLVDGVRVGDTESGLIDWSAVSASAVRRVEAARGPAAAMYGDSAVGGVIQFFTNHEASGGTLTASGGSFNAFTADGSYSRRRGSGGFTVSGATRRTDGAIDHSGGRQLVGATSADGRAAGLNLRWNLSADFRDRDDAGVSTRDAFVADPGTSDALFAADNATRHNVSTSLTAARAGDWMPQGRLSFSRRTEDTVRTILLAPGLGDRKLRELTTTSAGGSFDTARRFGAGGEFHAGLDFSHESLDTGYRDVDEAGSAGAALSDASGDRTRGGAFVSASWVPVSRLRASGAIRWDAVRDAGFEVGESRTQRAWSPRVGAVVTLNDTSTVSVQLSRAFKMPTLDQLFDPRPYPDFQGGSFFISNPALVPQRATNLEAGVSTGEAVRLSALVYRMAVDDEIDFDVRTFSYANIGASRHTGVELEAEAAVSTRVRPSFGYSLSRVTRAGESEQLKNVPRHAVTAAATLQLPLALDAYVRYSRTLGAYLDDENAFPIDGPSTVDLRVRRSLGRHAIFVDVWNLFNDRNEEYGYTLSDFTGQTVPYVHGGAPRTIRAGVNVTF
jgi:outer membrane cobalamin receptor